jgi:hypothetical protein
MNEFVNFINIQIKFQIKIYLFLNCFNFIINYNNLIILCNIICNVECKKKRDSF